MFGLARRRRVRHVSLEVSEVGPSFGGFGGKLTGLPGQYLVVGLEGFERFDARLKGDPFFEGLCRHQGSQLFDVVFGGHNQNLLPLST